MKRQKLTNLKVSSFLTTLATNEVTNTRQIKGGVHDYDPTGCICTVGLDCEFDRDPNDPGHPG